MLRRLAVLLALVFVLPASAHAADVTADGRAAALHRRARQGQQRELRRVAGDSGQRHGHPRHRRRRRLRDGHRLHAASPTVVTCTGVTSAAIDAGDMSDRITAYAVDDDSNRILGLNTDPRDPQRRRRQRRARRRRPQRQHRRRRGRRHDRRLRGQRRAQGRRRQRRAAAEHGHRHAGRRRRDRHRDATAGASRRRIRSTAWPTTAPRARAISIGTDIENVEGSADVDAQTVTITGDGRGNRLTRAGRQGQHHRRRGRRTSSRAPRRTTRSTRATARPTP